MIEVKRVFNKIEADILADFLNENGIPCLLSGDDAGGMRLHLGMQTGYRILVEDKFVDEAKSIIQSFEKTTHEP